MFDGMKDQYDEHMVGRYGGDALSRTCLIAAIVLVLLSFLCIGVSPFLYVLVLVLGIAAAIYAAVRMNSRDAEARAAENERFIGMFQRFGNRGEGASSARRDPRGEAGEGRRARTRREPAASRRSAEAGTAQRRAARPQPAPASEPQPAPEPEAQAAPAEKVTVACDNCGQKLRVPAGKGTVKVRCPKCQNVFTLTT